MVQRGEIGPETERPVVGNGSGWAGKGNISIGAIEGIRLIGIAQAVGGKGGIIDRAMQRSGGIVGIAREGVNATKPLVGACACTGWIASTNISKQVGNPKNAMVFTAIFRGYEKDMVWIELVICKLTRLPCLPPLTSFRGYRSKLTPNRSGVGTLYRQ